MAPCAWRCSPTATVSSVDRASSISSSSSRIAFNPDRSFSQLSGSAIAPLNNWLNQYFSTLRVNYSSSHLHCGHRTTSGIKLGAEILITLRLRSACEHMAKDSLKLFLSFDPQRLKQDLNSITDGKWTPHFNTSYYNGDWSGIALRSVGGESNAPSHNPGTE